MFLATDAPTLFPIFWISADIGDKTGAGAGAGGGMLLILYGDFDVLRNDELCKIGNITIMIRIPLIVV